MVFDFTRLETFLSIKEWYEHVRSECSPGVPVILLGNKIDVPNRALTSEQANTLAA